MSSVDWDLLVRAHTEASIQQVTLGYVINHHGTVFIARRHKFDYLDGCYELPQGVLHKGENLFNASRRILKKHFSVNLTSIDTFLHTFTYVSPKGDRCRAFIFAVRVEDPSKITLDRNDHGTWMQMGEYTYWPIITDFGQAMFNFWTGEGYHQILADTLIEQAKREGYWRYKMRVILKRENEFLLLKRARRNRTFPLYYELPGKEFTYVHDMDSVVVASITEQTGWPPTRIIGFLGTYDYQSQVSKIPVREFIFAACAQNERIKLSEHAYSVFVKDLSNKSLTTTPVVECGCKMFQDRFFLNRPEVIEMPPPVYFDPFEEKDLTLLSHLDAVDAMERQGKLELAALRGHPLRKRMIPKDLHKSLGLE